MNGYDLGLADLEGAYLRGAKLGLAYPERYSLRRAYLEGAKFCGTTMPDGTVRNDDC